MKLLIIISFLLIGSFVTASSIISAKYYVKNTGDDTKSGTSPTNAWQTLAKLNSFSFNPGDSIFLEHGSAWHESLTINTNNLYIGDYGSGAKPLISGLTSITAWTNTGGNIWESATAVSTLATCNLLTIDGANIQMGRYPNTGYLDYESFSGATSITSSRLTGDTNWTGSEAVIRLYYWLANCRTILSQSTGTITYPATNLPPQTVTLPQYGYYGFFIQKDIRTLDTLHEWYYNPSTKKISIYSSGTPPTAQVTTIDTLIYNNGFNNVTIKNISLKGANRFAIRSKNSTGLTIKSCDFDWSGNYALGVWNANTFVTIDSCTFNHTNRSTIFMESTADCHYPTITNNIIRNSGVIIGAGVDDAGNYKAIVTAGKGAVITNNRIDSTGYIPIVISNDSCVVKNNYVNTYCFRLDDGGGIYVAPSVQGLIFPHRRQVLSNIVLNGIGAPVGRALATLPAYQNDASSIYLDGTTGYVNVIGNTTNYSNRGIYLNNAHDVTIRDNNIIGGNNGFYFNQYHPSTPMDSIRYFNNIIVEKYATQLVMQNNLATDSTRMPFDFRADSNVYARPIADSNVINLLLVVSGVFIGYSWTLAQWQDSTGQDLHSTKSPKAIVDPSEIELYYNASNTTSSYRLFSDHIDMRGNPYIPDTYSLQPWSSIILMKAVSWNPTKWVVRKKIIWR